MLYNVSYLTLLSVCAIFSYVFAAGELNDDCSHYTDCRRFGYYCSSNRTCQCLPKYIPNKYGDKCLGLVNQRCKYDEHCMEGGYCKGQEKCTCKEGLYADEYDTECSSTGSIKSAAKTIELTVLLLFFYVLI